MSYSSDSLAQINDMDQLRQVVDQLDADLIKLLKSRFECMDAAARIKQNREAVRDENRKAAVIANVKTLAAEAAIPVPAIAAIWEILVETSISYEFQKWDSQRSD